MQTMLRFTLYVFVALSSICSLMGKPRMEPSVAAEGRGLALWYTQPAEMTAEVTNPWMEYALPIGNGQLGACLFGGVDRDEIQFNEKTLWTGSPDDMSSNYGQYKNFGSLFVESLDPPQPAHRTLHGQQRGKRPVDQSVSRRGEGRHTSA